MSSVRKEAPRAIFSASSRGTAPRSAQACTAATSPRSQADGAEVGPGLHGGDLHPQPGGELVLLRPDSGHLGAGVPGDHGLVYTGASGADNVIASHRGSEARQSGVGWRRLVTTPSTSLRFLCTDAAGNMTAASFGDRPEGTSWRGGGGARERL